jgi:hypothetical protein
MVRVDANLKKIFEQAQSPRIPTKQGQLGRLPFLELPELFIVCLLLSRCCDKV